MKKERVIILHRLCSSRIQDQTRYPKEGGRRHKSRRWIKKLHQLFSSSTTRRELGDWWGAWRRSCSFSNNRGGVHSNVSSTMCTRWLGLARRKEEDWTTNNKQKRASSAFHQVHRREKQCRDEKHAIHKTHIKGVGQQKERKKTTFTFSYPRIISVLSWENALKYSNERWFIS
jgi:hypothetical protein